MVVMYAVGQSQAVIKPPLAFAQSQARIKAFGVNGLGQSNAFIFGQYFKYGQSQAHILRTYRAFGQSQARILTENYRVAQSQAFIGDTVTGNPKYVWQDYFNRFQSSTWGTPDRGLAYQNYDNPVAHNINGAFGVASNIENVKFVQPIIIENAEIGGRFTVPDLADASIEIRIAGRVTFDDVLLPTDFINSDINTIQQVYMIIAGIVDTSFTVTLGTITDGEDSVVIGIDLIPRRNTEYSFKYRILNDKLQIKVWESSGVEPGPWNLEYTPITELSPGTILIDVDADSVAENVEVKFDYLYAVDLDLSEGNPNAQSAALIVQKGRGFGQSRAKIHRPQGYSQSQAFILEDAIPEPTNPGGGTTPDGSISNGIVNNSPPQYLVQYDGMVVPGYAQEEVTSSDMLINTSAGAFSNDSYSEYAGLTNKLLSLRMKVVGATYLDAKNQVQRAGTILRGRKEFAKLNIQEPDKYYSVLVQNVSAGKSVPDSMRMLEYGIDFEAKPWLYRDYITSITGTGTINTDVVGRTMHSGGWSPTKVLVTGTDVTISGYTATGDFTGYVTINGAVTDMLIDTEAGQVTMGGTYRNDLMNNIDFALYVGPGKTNFAITGASSCVISWDDRWYL